MPVIVLIEDDLDNAQFLVHILEPHGYEVHIAGNALDGLRIVKEIQPDLILLDLGLPDLDGKTVANRLRSLPNMAHTPIIAVTGDNTPATHRLAIHFGCNALISKPIDVETFPEQIASYLAG